MNIAEMNEREVGERLVEIRSKLQGDLTVIPTEELTAMNTEVDALNQRSVEIQTAIVTREKELERAMKTGVKVAEPPKEERKMEQIYNVKSPEYRSAFFKMLAGEQLNEVEQRAFTETTATFGGSLPTETAKEIWSNIEEEHPILGDIKMYRTGTVFEISVHTAIAAGGAEVTAQGAAPTETQNTYATVTLSGKDFSMSVDIGYAMKMMAAPALEEYLISEISEQIGAKMAADVIAQIVADAAAGNKKTSAAVKVTTYVELNSLFALLKASKGAVVYANEATIYNYLTSIVDTTGRPVFQPNANDDIVGYLLGKPVKIESAGTDNLFYIGNPKKVAGNMVQDIMIESAKDVKKHVYTYSGYARFECKLTNDKAFVVFTVKQA